MIQRGMLKAWLVISIVLTASYAWATVPVGVHTGARPSYDSVSYNQYTQATLPTTITWPFLSSPSSNGTVATCSDCTPSFPPAGGITRPGVLVCQWVQGVALWDCETLNGNVTIMDYGAKCDGVTDDTAAIVAAIADADKNDVTIPNRNVVVPNGRKCEMGTATDFHTLTVTGGGVGIFGGNPHTVSELDYTGSEFPANSLCAFFGVGEAHGVRFHGPWVQGDGAGKLTGVCPATTDRSYAMAHAPNIVPLYDNIRVDGFSIACIDLSTAIVGTAINGGWVKGSKIDNCPIGLRAFGGKNFTTTTTAPVTYPSATIPVADTSSFGLPRSTGNYLIYTTDGGENNAIRCTGKTPTSFTGCTQGTGTWPTGSPVWANGNIVGFNIDTNTIENVGIGIDLGPANALTEYGEAIVSITNNHIQIGDAFLVDIMDEWNIITGGQQNFIAYNYLSSGPNPPPGQTWHANIDTTFNGQNTTLGGNVITGNNCTGGPASGSMTTLKTDIIFGNNRGCSTVSNNINLIGELSADKFGSTPPPNDMEVQGGQAGTQPYSIALVCITHHTSKAGNSTWKTILDAPNVFDATHGVRSCWGPMPQCEAVDVLISGVNPPPTPPTASIALAQGFNGNSGFNCFSDFNGPGASSPYTPVNDQTGRGFFGSSADAAIDLYNGGHISSLIGSGVAPTPGTGSATAPSTDLAGVITGCTSPCTVTFGTPYHAAPVCTANDRATATAAIVNGETTAHFVVTTAGTDSFSYNCVGK